MDVNSRFSPTTDWLLTLTLTRVREVTSEVNSAIVLINIIISVIFIKQLMSNEELIISQTD